MPTKKKFFLILSIKRDLKKTTALNLWPSLASSDGFNCFQDWGMGEN